MGFEFWHRLCPMDYMHAVGVLTARKARNLFQNYQLATFGEFLSSSHTLFSFFSLQFSTCPTKSLGWFQRVLYWLFLVSSLVALYGQQITLPLLPLHRRCFFSICCLPLFWMLDILCQIGYSLEILVPSFCMLSLGPYGMQPQLVYLSMVSIGQE